MYFRSQGLQKSFDPGADLPAALPGIVGFQQEHGPVQPVLQPGVFIGIIVTELHRMVNDPVYAACETADQLIPVGRLFHPHTGELA